MGIDDKALVVAVADTSFAVFGGLLVAWTVLLLARSNKITTLGRKSKVLSNDGTEL